MNQDQEPTKVEPASCHFCEGPTDAEHFCYGCKQYICDGCSVNQCVAGHGHAPEEHLVPMEDF